MLTCSSVAAETISWINPVGGTWEMASNWSSSKTPVPEDDVLISGTGTGKITVNAGATIHILTLSGGPKLALVSGKLQLSPILPQYLLNISKTGTGSCTVSSSPAAIDCGLTCSASFEKGSIVTLTESTAPDSIFTGWSGGGCSGTGNCFVTMNADTTVTATIGLCRAPLTCTANFVNRCGMFSDACGGTVTCSCSGIKSCVGSACICPDAYMATTLPSVASFCNGRCGQQINIDTNASGILVLVIRGGCPVNCNDCGAGGG